jgi:regulator of protease activity HflC (stomatin/prohibitin superfamily)
MNQKSQVAIIVAIVAVVVLIFFGSSMFFTLKPGERAVIFRKFTSGLDKENILTPGFHVVAPWNDLIRYVVREQSREETLDVLDKSGLTLNVDVFVRFNPTFQKLGRPPRPGDRQISGRRRAPRARPGAGPSPGSPKIFRVPRGRGKRNG